MTKMTKMNKITTYLFDKYQLGRCLWLTTAWFIGCVNILAVQVAQAAPELEEVIVTATKRSASSQTIPLSISAVTGEDLEAQGATEFFDYAITIPNLSFGATTDGILSGRSISIRGIAGQNTTGFYIDDTPITETIDPRLLEIERIEVLRGPSGTLYGARSLGGTIRQITRKASPGELFGKIRAGFSDTQEASDGNYLVSGSVNIPLGDRAAILISGLYEDQAGVFDRAVGTISNHLSAPATLSGPANFINEDVDDRNTVASQIALTLRPIEALTIEPRVMYQRAELDGFPLADIDPENFVQNRDFNVTEGGEDDWTLYTLNINYEITAGTLTSASSYFDRETFEVEGSGSFINFLQAGPFGLFDVIPVTPLTSPIFQTLQYESFTQELRFSSDFGGPFEVVAGAFYQDIDDREAFQPRNFATGLGDNFALLAMTLNVEDTWPFGDLVFTADRPSTVEEFGLYGEFTFDLTEKTAAVFGVRYYDTEVSFMERAAGLAVGLPLANDVSLSTVDPTIGSQSEDGFNFKAALEYQATDDLFVYGLIAEGFRIGGANGTIPNALGCPEDLVDLGLAGTDTSSFNSDDLLSYEVGVKADVGDASRINATIFYINFDNIQQRVQLECGFQFTGNFGSARSRGVEFEYLSQPLDNLTIGLNLGYTSAEFTETVSGVAVSGEALQQVPELTASFNLDYVMPDLIGDYDFFVYTVASYVDDSISRVNSIERVRDSYEQVNLRLGLRNETYSVALFIRNLTNDIANLSDNRSLAAETPGRPRFVVSRPRTIGAELRYEF